MIIGIIADGNKGGTFLSWTLHYLAGHKEYFSCQDGKFIELPTNILTDVNAHGFQPNQPNTLIQFKEYLNLISNIKNDLFQTFYFHRFKIVPEVTTPICCDTSQAVSQLQSITDKVILLYNHADHALYDIKFKQRSLGYKQNSTVEISKTDEDFHNDWIETYFVKSKKEFENLRSTDIWDYREFLALSMHPYAQLSIVPNFDQTKKHFPLNCFELFNNFNNTVVDLFFWLGLPIDESKLDNWNEIYKKWKGLHTDRILFVEYFDSIIDSIIHGYYMDLSRFKLDILQEATIQHVLIYKHGLTLKTWGLKKFPDNTQDLYKLLETNIYHQVEDIYNCLDRK